MSKPLKVAIRCAVIYNLQEMTSFYQHSKIWVDVFKVKFSNSFVFLLFR